MYGVVAISRTLAAGGDVIGQIVARHLGFRYVDEEILTRAAEKANLDVRRIAEAEHRPSHVALLLQVLPHAISDPLPVGSLSYDETNPRPAARPDFRVLIRDTIREVAKESRAVIVAHAASMALAGTALRVLVTASIPTRVNRLRLLTQEEAHRAIAESDRDRRDYFHRFYDIAEELPTHYDVVVNTDLLSPEHAANIVVAAARG